MAQGRSLFDCTVAIANRLSQLHIIENRFKLEREIIRGRQNLRPVNSRDRAMQDILVQRQAKIFEGTPALHQGHLRAGIPFPPQLAIESDAEAAFAKGSPRFFKRPHHRQSSPVLSQKVSSNPTSDHSSKSNDPLASVEGRQKWATTLLESGAAQSQDAGATDGPRVAVSGSNDTSSTSSPQLPLTTRSGAARSQDTHRPRVAVTRSNDTSRTPSPTLSPIPPQSPSFLSCLGRRSFAALPSAFPTFRRSDGNNLHSQVHEDGNWSSDSSSSDYPLDESSGSRLQRASFIPDVNGRFKELGLSSDEKGNADDGLKDYVDDDSPDQDA